MIKANGAVIVMIRISSKYRGKYKGKCP